MKIKEKILVFCFLAVIISGCSVVTTKTIDKKGKVEILKKEVKVGKKEGFFKTMGTIATVLFLGNTKNGVAILSPVLQYKAAKEAREQSKCNIAEPKRI